MIGVTAEGLGTMPGCADKGLVKAAGLELPPTGLPEELDFVPCSGPGPDRSAAQPFLGWGSRWTPPPSCAPAPLHWLFPSWQHRLSTYWVQNPGKEMA